jgi:hypothetical protein
MIATRGGPQLVAGLEAIAAGLEHLDEAARVTAELLELDARGRAPKRSGALARSVKGTAHGMKATVGTPVSYGLPVHFGVPSRNQRAQPFLADAVRAQDTAVLAAWARDTQRLIDEAVH